MKYLKYGIIAAIIASPFVFNSFNASEFKLTVHKSETCGCCEKWMDHMSKDFDVSASHPSSLTEFKAEKGIPSDMQSCHTAISDQGFVFEGHIPRTIVENYLQSEKSEGSIGLAVPGMPIGSPGMEMGGQFSRYTVFELFKDGRFEVYEKVISKDEQY